MSARLRRAVIATVAAALSVGLSAGVAAGTHHSSSQRVVADHIWCC